VAALVAGAPFGALGAGESAVEAPLEARYPEAVEVFHCAFDPSWDENYDGWPDGWTRRRGRGFPHYVRIAISDEPSPEGGRCLRIDLDGGGAVAYSPPIPASHLYSYVLEGFVKTEGLVHNRAFFSVTLLDADRRRLETFTSRTFRSTAGWRKVRLGPLAAAADRARWAIIGLHVEPGAREDLRGAAAFDDVWLGRLSRMTLAASDPFNFFTEAGQVEITCEVSGFSEPRPVVSFTLEDALGGTIERIDRPMTLTSTAEAGAPALDGPDGAAQPARTATTRWRPPVPGPGFYRVRATLAGRTGLVHDERLSLAVVEPQRAPPRSEFGWTLPRGEAPLGLARLATLLGHAGVRRLKFPVWFDDAMSDQQIEQLVNFTDRLAGQELEIVGLFRDPPRRLRERYGRRGRALSAAELFAPGPEVWYPSFEPALSRLATRVRHWQLGDDEDASFVHYPDAAGKLREIKDRMDRIGQDVHLGVGWSWIDALPKGKVLAGGWCFLALSADPALSHEELSLYLAESSASGVRRWVVLKPLSRRHYATEVRAEDLVRRMIAAKIEGAEAIFCPDPFDPDHGLMNEDGTPGELFLPWRTTALALGGARYLGGVELPGGSPNHVFARGDEAMMIVWNEHPTEEALYLGEEVRQIDLWGRATTPDHVAGAQVIRADRLPSIVTGLSAPVARWRMSLRLAEQRLPSVFGRVHGNRLTFQNDFPRGASGRATLVMPEVWEVEPRQFDFRLAEGETLDRPFDVLLPYNASSGRHPVRIDFEIQADRPYRFSAYRQVDVGLGDVYLQVLTRLSDAGQLEVEQRTINEGAEPVSFRCQLYVPGRRRQRADVVNLAPGRDVKIYRLDDGAELIGKALWLRAEEVGGPRVLNYRFTAEK
jgi:hypothetical protein